MVIAEDFKSDGDHDYEGLWIMISHRDGLGMFFYPLDGFQIFKILLLTSTHSARVHKRIDWAGSVEMACVGFWPNPSLISQNDHIYKVIEQFSGI